MMASAMIDCLCSGSSNNISGNISSSDGDHPLTLIQLGKLVDSQVSSRDLLRAARSRLFLSKAIAVRSGDTKAPVSLHADLENLVSSPITLRYLINLLSEGKSKAHTIAKLAAKVSGRLNGQLRQKFVRSVRHQIDQERLPADIGWIMVGRCERLFLLKDLHPTVLAASIRQSQESVHKVASMPVSDNSDQHSFPALFDSAFEKLNRNGGGFNFVSLELLRMELPNFSRDEFDGQLRNLRLARRYRLSGAENRSDVTPRQREAGIREAGSLLLYAQRIDS
jgi:hypothetical protein